MASSNEIFKLAQLIFADVTNSEEKLQQMRVMLNEYVAERQEKNVDAETIAKNITKAFTEAFKKHIVAAGDNPNTLKALFAARGAEFSVEQFGDAEQLKNIETILSQVAVWVRDESTPLLTVEQYVEKLNSLQNEPDAEEVVAPKEEIAAPKEEVVAPKEEIAAPKEEVVAPKEEVVAPKEEVVAPKEEVVAPVAASSTTAPSELLAKLARRSAKNAAAAPKQTATVSAPVVAPVVTAPVVAPVVTAPAVAPVVVAPVVVAPVVVAPVVVAPTATLEQIGAEATQAFYNGSNDVYFSALQASVNDFLTVNPADQDDVVDTIATALRNVLADPNLSTTSIRVNLGAVKPESVTPANSLKIARGMVNNILAGAVKAHALEEITPALADPKAYAKANAVSSVPSTPKSVGSVVAPVAAKPAAVVANTAPVVVKPVVSSTPVKAAATAPSFVGASPELQAKLAKRLSLVEPTQPVQAAKEEEEVAVKPATTTPTKAAPVVPAKPAALLKQLEAQKAKAATLKQAAAVTVEAPTQEVAAEVTSASKAKNNKI